MKTLSRVIARSLTLTALLLPIVLSAQQRPADQQTATDKQTPPATGNPAVLAGASNRIPAVSGQRLPQSAEIKPLPRQQPKYPTMPNLIGFEVREAERLLISRAPNVRVTRKELERFTPNYRPGVVVNQSPKEGTVLRPGSDVALYYNPKPPQPPNYPRMPDLVGQDVRSAGVRLSELPDVQWRREAARIYSPDYRPGIVVAQFPAAGTILKLGTVAVLYYNPRPPVTPAPDPTYLRMPDLIGLDLRAAARRLSELPNIQWRREAARSFVDGYGPGVVVSQSPAAGTFLKPGSVAVLTYNPQRPSTPTPTPTPTPYPRMPNLVGLDLRAADRALFGEAPNVQRRVETARIFTPNFRPGTVVVQSPVAGTILRPGAPVVLYLNPQLPLTPTPTPARPSTPVPVTVPDLRGLTFGRANDILKSLALNASAVNNPRENFDAYNVTEQRPQPGALLAVGGTVFLTVEPPQTTPTPTPTSPPTPTPALTPTPAPPPVTVPDVRKKDLTEAISLLRASNLEVGEVTGREAKDAVNSVLEQQPPPGGLAAAGSRVNLVIAEPAKSAGFFNVAAGALTVVALGFGSLLLARLLRKSRLSRNGKNQPTSPAPALSFRSTMNQGWMGIESDTGMRVRHELRFQPKADFGRQYIILSGKLIAAESEEL